MLDVVEWIMADGEPRLDYDPYVPLTITWQRYSRLLQSPRIVGIHSEAGYIEFKLDPESGELVEVVVPAATPIRAVEPPCTGPGMSGLWVPVIREAAEPAEASSALRFTVYYDTLKITISGRRDEHLRGDGPVWFGTDETGALSSLTAVWTEVGREAFLAACSS